jgi:hypothetical protein
VRKLIVASMAFMLLADVAARSNDQPATAPSAAPTTAPTSRPWILGIYVEDANDVEGMKDHVGAMGGNLFINWVVPGSRAEKMGLKELDVIRRVNGKEMRLPEQVLEEVHVSAKVTIDIIRNGDQSMTLTEESKDRRMCIRPKSTRGMTFLRATVEMGAEARAYQPRRGYNCRCHSKMDREGPHVSTSLCNRGMPRDAAGRQGKALSALRRD